MSNKKKPNIKTVKIKMPKSRSFRDEEGDGIISAGGLYAKLGFLKKNIKKK